MALAAHRSNGQTISASGESFDSLRNAEQAATRANPGAPTETDTIE